MAMGAIDSGNTAFIIMSMALVNLMTPGLAFFYGGLVRQQNVLTIIMQNYVSMGLITIVWVIWAGRCRLNPVFGPRLLAALEPKI